MKLSKEELLSKVDGLGISDEDKIGLMEDITDSLIDNTEELTRQIQELTDKVAEITAKYKERFLTKEEVQGMEEPEEEVQEVEEPKEEEVIDVKEI